MKKTQLNEVKQLQKIAGILKETEHPDDTSSNEIDDAEENPDDFDDVSEKTNEEGRTTYELVKGPNEDPLVKNILVYLHNQFKDKYHYDPYMNRLTISGEANEDARLIDLLSKLFAQPEYQD